MQSRASTVEQYLAELPDERRQAIEAVRKTILENLPEGYEEGMQYGMIGYFVPHRLYPPGYHCDPKQPLPFASLASQKNHLAIYLSCLYSDPRHEAWFREAWAKTGKRLDMGKSCVRFKRLEDVPLDLIGQAVQRVPVDQFVAHYETIRIAAGGEGARRTAKKKKATPSPKAAARKIGSQKPASPKSSLPAKRGGKKASAAGSGSSRKVRKKRDTRREIPE